MRYRLRTLLIVVTGICCFMGYELEWIRKRRAFLDWDYPSGHEQYSVYRVIDTRRVGSAGTYTIAPSALWLFGEKGIYGLWFYIQPEDVLRDPAGRDYIRSTPAMAAARRLFPESKVSAGITKDGQDVDVEIRD
jgi:hypothetical protein